MNKIILSSIILSLLLALGSFSGCYYDDVIPDVSIYEGVEYSFSEDIVPIFNTSCNLSDCHGTGEEPPDLSAANAYNSLVNNGYINVDDPELSELYQWVAGNRATTMPIAGTDPKIVAAVLTWISQGAENN